ncbi:TIGR02594 family protein [Tenacibaculum finnmarkense genomovar finnmarkense]|uniref:TIGR02594 family protein n=1 Tax=Tenacibaculum finnmarkense TaxID=2781243 RepID=UPI001E368E89|nr:TIGR02594 family protein [Tenacibaculum finnmarkense]MCD8418541.1 TIGR02594 family protein [Tenacibaculum finnmarkense genomovar finnmarkense]MCG8186906.1 TIGR02594 family protein [Tenacibaculum finnmarkense genomovar finnmarkense]MCG8203431.1 TIGR02594 family protein [Tenacibaculum finnmarkense genomovar finnmarkense]MCG8210914.1 TIGR02594 family protein [Tenacibaculum finnmarkense genomovar finnmarkense]MCG8213713.1 TIGR02594 family protein [Tenacibaculum finnmarkense genomovar finnmarken
MVPFAWEKKHGSIAEVPRYFYLKYESEEFPRAYYTVKINTKNETDKKDSVKGMRVSALMLKVAKTLQLKKAIEGSNAVVLGEELSKSTNKMKEIEEDGRAPWMKIAIEESKKAKGCVESLEPMYSMAKSYLRFVGNQFEPTDGTYGPWCASFMNWCMNKSGHKYAKSASSLAPIHNNFKALFRKIEKPIYGCIVVYKHKTKWKGHTGFLYGLDKAGNYLLLGGNQGNTINIEKYGEYTSKSKSKKLYGFYVPVDYKISEADYLTEKEKNLNKKEENKKIGVTNSKNSTKTT